MKDKLILLFIFLFMTSLSYAQPVRGSGASGGPERGGPWVYSNGTDISFNNGNVGIGTTTPQTMLAVTGNVGIGTWTSDGGKLTVMGGNVGIGTTVSSYPLEIKTTVANPISITSSNIDNQIRYSNISAGGNTWFSGATGNGDSSGVGFVWYNQTTGSPKMIITNAGNIGIGTTTPQGGLTVMNGNVGIGTFNPFGSLIVAPGNVGIGTFVPQSTLEVKGTFRTIGASTSPWTKKAGANTACDTTCATSQCAFGEDSAVLGTLLSCSDATADVCICTGP